MLETLALMGHGFVNAMSLSNLLFMAGGTAIGIIIGCLPGLSAAMGVALLLPMTFTMAPETGLIVLGAIYCGAIFGGSISAILIHTPGTELFTRYAPMTYTFFAGFVLVQFFMLGIGLLGCRGFAQISRLSDAILIPSVAVLCVVGSFAIHKNFFDVVIMMIFGVLGYLVRKFDLNPAAIVLALILGPIGENGLRRSLRLSGGSPAILFSTPLCWVLIALCVFGVCSPIFMNRMEKMAVENAGGDIPNETGDDPVRTSD